jgi:hypothetical protein
LLNFSSMLLTFLSGSWIDFLTSFVCFNLLWSCLKINFWMICLAYQEFQFSWN